MAATKGVTRTGTRASRARAAKPRTEMGLVTCVVSNVCQQQFIRTRAATGMKKLLTEALTLLTAGLPEPGT
jgi:hypothetical protein